MGARAAPSPQGSGAPPSESCSNMPPPAASASSPTAPPLGPRRRRTGAGPPRRALSRGCSCSAGTASPAAAARRPSPLMATASSRPPYPPGIGSSKGASSSRPWPADRQGRGYQRQASPRGAGHGGKRCCLQAAHTARPGVASRCDAKGKSPQAQRPAPAPATPYSRSTASAPTTASCSLPVPNTPAASHAQPNTGPVTCCRHTAGAADRTTQDVCAAARRRVSSSATSPPFDRLASKWGLPGLNAHELAMSAGCAWMGQVRGAGQERALGFLHHSL
jgi:hypothetical protein